MRKVYVVQNQHRWDHAKQAFVPKFDLHAAEEFGELTFLLGPTASPFRPGPLIEELVAKLRDFSDADSLLCIGNPLLIGWSMAIAADANDGRVASLQWSGKDQRYIRVEAAGL